MDESRRVNGTGKPLTTTTNDDESMKLGSTVTEDKLKTVELSGPMSIMNISEPVRTDPVSYTHLTLPTIYSV